MKAALHDSRAFIRTGEMTPYANILLKAALSLSCATRRKYDEYNSDLDWTRTVTWLGAIPNHRVKNWRASSKSNTWINFRDFDLCVNFAVVNGMGLPTGMDLVFSILSGVGWAIAQIITFQSFTLVGSSRAMPITTAFQLLGASLWGVFALGDWPGVGAKLLGGLALVLIILGAWMTVWTEEKHRKKPAF